MANRNFVIVRIDRVFCDMLKAKSKKMGDIGMRNVTKQLATADFDRLMDMQLSKRNQKLFRIK